MLTFMKRNLFSHSFSVRIFQINVRSKTSRKFTMHNNITVERQWINNPLYQNCNFDQQKINGTVVTVMSYNILAQDLIDKHTYLYNEHNPLDLRYEVRSERLFHEMKMIKPDILCLQEVQDTHLMELKLKCFSIDLDEVIFKKRTQAGLTDGCAIFFNSKVMDLVHDERVEYLQPNVFVLNRANVAIIAKFRLKNGPHTELVVATTHLLYNPRRQDVRLAQIQILLSEIDRVAYRGIDERQLVQYTPVILTGDFNFQPTTAPYFLIANGYLDYSSLVGQRLVPATHYNDSRFGNVLLPIKLGVTDDCQHFDRTLPMLHNTETRSKLQLTEPIDKLAEARLPFGTGKLKHQLNFCSAYDDTVAVSTYQNKWVLVDYIFYRKEFSLTNQPVEQSLKLLARFELPTRDQCYYHLPNGGIPNASQGSDHYSLAAKFLLSAPSKATK